MFYQERNNRAYRKCFLLFAAGFMLGIVLINFNSSLFAGENGIFNASSLNRMKYLEIENGAFFRYVMTGRLKRYLLLAVLSTTYFGIVASYSVATWQGMMMGMVITVAVIRFGIKGMLLVITSFFPHQLLLLPAGAMMLIWCYQNCVLLYFSEGNAWIREKKRKYLLRQFTLLLWILTVVIIGCILESYVNPILLSDIVNFF